MDVDPIDDLHGGHVRGQNVGQTMKLSSFGSKILFFMQTTSIVFLSQHSRRANHQLDPRPGDSLSLCLARLLPSLSIADLLICNDGMNSSTFCPYNKVH